jgi:hypothetical protein
MLAASLGAKPVRRSLVNEPCRPAATGPRAGDRSVAILLDIDASPVPHPHTSYSLVLERLSSSTAEPGHDDGDQPCMT